MAKAKKKVNKSQEVRAFLAANPDAGPSEVAQALKSLRITPGYVSNIKTKMKGKSRRRGGGADSKGIVAAAELIQMCGGAKEAQEALQAAEKVADLLAS